MTRVLDRLIPGAIMLSLLAWPVRGVVWAQSTSLAYPGGLTLPRTLADVSALIAGGYRRILLT